MILLTFKADFFLVCSLGLLLWGDLGYADQAQALLVEKATNTMQRVEPSSQGYRIIETFHVTLGQVAGDKVSEKDLKTPEGIYLIQSILKGPGLYKKLGIMAFDLNFPNPFDKMAGTTGSGIMVHATHEPDRLQKKYDSEGCVVLTNEEIQRIAPYVKVGLTPVLIFDTLKADYLNPHNDTVLQALFNNWLKAWKEKDIERYIQSYHSEFTSQRKNKSQWKEYKQSLNSRYLTIRIDVDQLHFYKHPKYSLITFRQEYSSIARHPKQKGYTSRGTKILYIAQEDNQPKIISEDFTKTVW